MANDYFFQLTENALSCKNPSRVAICTAKSADNYREHKSFKNKISVLSTNGFDNKTKEHFGAKAL